MKKKSVASKMKAELVSHHNFTPTESMNDMGGNTGNKDLKGKEGWSSIKKDMKSGSKTYSVERCGKCNKFGHSHSNCK